MMYWHTAGPGDSGISDKSVGVVQNVRAVVTYGPWIFRRHWAKRSVPGGSRAQLDIYYMWLRKA